MQVPDTIPVNTVLGRTGIDAGPPEALPFSVVMGGGGGGGGTPGGANTDVQFNGTGAFAGDAGFTYAGNGQVTHALGTITANAIALNITATWNNAAVTFDAPFFMNITDTASNALSSFLDIQRSGVSNLILQQPGAGIGFPTLSLGPGPALSGALPGSTIYTYRSVDDIHNPGTYERGVFGWMGGAGFGFGNTDMFVIGTQGSAGSTNSGGVMFANDRQGRFLFGFANDFNGFGVCEVVDLGEQFHTSIATMVHGWSPTNNIFSVSDEAPDAYQSREAAGIVQWGQYRAPQSPFAHRIYNTRGNNDPANFVTFGYERAEVGWQQQANIFTISTIGVSGSFGTFNNRDISIAPGTGITHLGLADAAAPVAQTHQAQSVVAGTSNTAGADFTMVGSAGTGTGAGGAIVFKTAPAGGAGSTQNTPAEVLRLLGAGNIKYSNAASFSANGAVATVLGSIGPTGSHTTVQTWLTFVDSGGVTRYVPCF